MLGIWAHRQARAARDAGADLTVFVLHRLVPPKRSFTPGQLLHRLRQPTRTKLDGIPVVYVRYVSPPRQRSYARWGAWVAPQLRRALQREGNFDLVHVHNAVPAGDAALRSGVSLPLIVSVHGSDVFWTARSAPGGQQVVRRTLAAARLVLANSAGAAELAKASGARETEVVHLGADRIEPAARAPEPLVVTVGHLIPRKRQGDVIRALARLPLNVRYLVIGDGPEGPTLKRLAAELGVADRVELAGQLEPTVALARASSAWLFVMPSTDEAFGVAYVEAMAAGIPAIGAVGEPGPEEIAALGGGIELVPAGDPDLLAQKIQELLRDPGRLRALSNTARRTVAAQFTWSSCGERTVEAYRKALRT